MLPVENEAKEQYYRLPHNLEFSQIANMFELLNYARPYTSWADLSSTLKTAYMRNHTIIEIKVSATEGSTIYKNLLLNKSRAQAVIGD